MWELIIQHEITSSISSEADNHKLWYLAKNVPVRYLRQVNKSHVSKLFQSHVSNFCLSLLTFTKNGWWLRSSIISWVLKSTVSPVSCWIRNPKKKRGKAVFPGKQGREGDQGKKKPQLTPQGYGSQSDVHQPLVQKILWRSVVLKLMESNWITKWIQKHSNLCYAKVWMIHWVSDAWVDGLAFWSKLTQFAPEVPKAVTSSLTSSAKEQMLLSVEASQQNFKFKTTDWINPNSKKTPCSIKCNFSLVHLQDLEKNLLRLRECEYLKDHEILLSRISPCPLWRPCPADFQVWTIPRWKTKWPFDHCAHSCWQCKMRWRRKVVGKAMMRNDYIIYIYILYMYDMHKCKACISSVNDTFKKFMNFRSWWQEDWHLQPPKWWKDGWLVMTQSFETPGLGGS